MERILGEIYFLKTGKGVVGEDSLRKMEFNFPFCFPALRDAFATENYSCLKGLDFRYFIEMN